MELVKSVNVLEPPQGDTDKCLFHYHYNKSVVRIVLLGLSVSENSDVGNFILGRAAFDSEAPPDVVERVTGRLKDRHVIIINSPQLLQTNISDHQITQTVRECVHLSDPGPHVFILVLQHKHFTEEDLTRVKHVLKQFSEDAIKHTIVITTDQQTRREKANESIQQLTAECGGGHFQFKDKNKITQILKMVKNSRKRKYCETIKETASGSVDYDLSESHKVKRRKISTCSLPQDPKPLSDLGREEFESERGDMAFNNRETQDKTQVTQLLNMIEKLKNTNQHRYSTNSIFDEEKWKEREKEIHEKLKVKHEKEIKELLEGEQRNTAKYNREIEEMKIKFEKQQKEREEEKRKRDEKYRQDHKKMKHENKKEKEIHEKLRVKYEKEMEELKKRLEEEQRKAEEERIQRENEFRQKEDKLKKEFEKKERTKQKKRETENQKRSEEEKQQRAEYHREMEEMKREIENQRLQFEKQQKEREEEDRKREEKYRQDHKKIKHEYECTIAELKKKQEEEIKKRDFVEKRMREEDKERQRLKIQIKEEMSIRRKMKEMLKEREKEIHETLRVKYEKEMEELTEILEEEQRNAAKYNRKMKEMKREIKNLRLHFEKQQKEREEDRKREEKYRQDQEKMKHENECAMSCLSFALSPSLFLSLSLLARSAFHAGTFSLIGGCGCQSSFRSRRCSQPDVARQFKERSACYVQQFSVLGFSFPDFSHPSVSNLNLVVCGCDETLKSSISELILQQKDRRSDMKLHGRQISLVELPALIHLSEEEVMHQTLRCVSLCDPGVHAFLIISPVGPLINEDKEEIEKLQKIFDSRQHFVLLFTSDHSVEGLATDFVKSNTETWRLISHYGGQYRVMGLEEPRSTRQIPELLDYIENMKNEPYSAQMYVTQENREQSQT
ncbi:hypothetical protein QQF64_025995 [Cirrhinus molitorella]|uniref:AIG1-type G domain-containing protein n=1 Tax=Cirrhinus molitorella TaxID=172907 RepID=A0ABR3NR18_9TELE